MKNKIIKLLDRHLVSTDEYVMKCIADEILVLIKDEHLLRIKNIEHNTAKTLEKITQLR